MLASYWCSLSGHEVDRKPFREELAKCCPSFSSLSASELLDQLIEDVAFLEVASGFGAKPNPLNDRLTGMTVEDLEVGRAQRAYIRKGGIGKNTLKRP